MATGSAVTAPRVALSFDTCGANGTVALVELQNDTDAVTCMNQIELGDRSASAQLMPAVSSLLSEAGRALRSLHALIVVHGPGSFTGERVGLSTVKGLAHASGVPVVAVSRLEVLASLVAEESFVALLDAGRNEFYARRGKREWLASLAEITAAAEAGAALLTAEEPIAKRLAAWHPRLAGPLDAFAAARAAVQRVRARDFDDFATLDANYLRRSDAELFARPASQPAL